MKCLMKYGWVKLPRGRLPEGKGILGAWARLAARAAYHRGVAFYYGHSNEVTPGMWSGGVTGLKSILKARTRAEALQTLDTLAKLGYLTCELDTKTKKLTYQIRDWVANCTGEACMGKAVYATDGYGFLCLPRGITGRLAAQQYRFEEADAWLDLWCHTVFEDPNASFSGLAPVIQYGKSGAALTLETLGRRWGWEKTKVWRFFKKHRDAFALYRLPGSLGCLVFNKLYPAGAEITLPCQQEVLRILAQMRICKGYAQKKRTSGNVCSAVTCPDGQAGQQKPAGAPVAGTGADALIRRVALSAPIIRIRAYLSPCRNWKNCKNDCREEKEACRCGIPPGPKPVRKNRFVRPAALHGTADLTQIAKECFSW